MLEQGWLRFMYLSSNLSSDCEATSEVKCTLARASKAFGALRVPIFNSHLSINTKRSVYTAVIISILLYGAETWTLKAPAVRMLTSFHNRCVRTILGVTRYSQWKEHITTAQFSARFGMPHSIADYLLDRKL